MLSTLTFLEPLEVECFLHIRTTYSWWGFRKDSRSNAIFGSPVFLILNRYVPLWGLGFFKEFSEIYTGKFLFMSFLFKSYQFQFNIWKLEKVYVCKNEICVWKKHT